MGASPRGFAVEMHQIRYFLAVARELNFTRAARACNVSQPALSRAISQLEHEFGGKVFLREPDNIRLTELGRIVRPFLEATLETAETAATAARQAARPALSQIRIGIMCTIAPEMFTELLLAMRARHPNVELSLVDGRAADLEQRLLENQIDAAVYAIPTGSDPEKTHAMPLFREQMVVVLNREHKLANYDRIAWADLDGECYINRVNCEFNGAPDDVLGKRVGTRRVIYRSDRDDWVQMMVASGAGFSFMPRGCVTSSGVVARPLSDPDVWREVNFTTVRGRPHSAGLGALVHEVAALGWSRSVGAAG
jgi:LysR family hydrogen peroxide-inducible transcriptional activator